MHRGYILVWRKIQDSGLMQMPNTLAVFLHILFSATHKDIKVGTPHGAIMLKRGQYISGRKKLAEELEQTEQTIRTSLKNLEKLEILTIKSTSKYSIYTIENYELYQNPDSYLTKELTNSQPTANQQLTTKQEHNKHKSHKIELADNGEWLNINGQLEVWKKAYPKINIDQELKKAASWIISNPSRRKQNYARFLNGWFDRANPVVTSSYKEDDYI